MLMGIPKIISPELLKILCEMGHGDKILIADGNFPSESIGKNAKVVRMDGHGTCDVLKAILKLFPLDTYVEKPVCVMQIAKGDSVDINMREEYEKIIKQEQNRTNVIQEFERFEFYKQSKEVYAIIATGESTKYANITLQKGVITDAI